MIKFNYEFGRYTPKSTIVVVTIAMVLAALALNLGVFALLGVVLSLIWNTANLVPQHHIFWWQGALVGLGLYLCGRLLGFGRKSE